MMPPPTPVVQAFTAGASVRSSTRPFPVGKARADIVQAGIAFHPADLLAVYRRFAGRLEPLALDTQLIHGDLVGNVMFDADETPVVIDFSPYVRPVRYATAIVACDALLWEGAGPEVLASTITAAASVGVVCSVSITTCV